MAMQTQLTAELLFDNGETKNVSASPYKADSVAVANFKGRVMAVNALENPDLFARQSLILNGGNFQKIKSATITTTEKTVIYARSEAARLKALEMGVNESGVN